MLPSSYEGSLSRPGDDLIIEGWLDGKSTAEISRRTGRTKNAIVGRAHRMMAMGLIDPRPSPIRRDGHTPQRAPQPPRIKGPTLPPLASIAAADASEPPLAVPRAPDARPRPSRAVRTPVVINAGPAGGDMFNHATFRPAALMIPPTVRAKPYGRVVTCCWPIGEPGAREFHFCDVPSEPGRPYCEDHVRIAYVKVRDRREDYAT